MTRYLKTLIVALVAAVMAVGELRDAEAQEHGAFSLGFYGMGDASATAWALEFGDSAEAAEFAADMRCHELLRGVSDGNGYCGT